MNKQKLLKIVNPLLGLFFAIQAITGMFHALIPYEFFRPIHAIAGYAMVFVATVHVILNWGWIKTNMMKKR